ncbi:hypothetical protein Ahy_B03g064186 isoform E [Arachis hypogaea]|uniref:Uncharacterized protein n=1 Tax=Arachis hypogaea TaxID=3818 RepID=A0A444ZYW1_ARAHY|nr:hypothetical protein Ahy_B03g064186 isoform E [Arachis hypogaea]
MPLVMTPLRENLILRCSLTLPALFTVLLRLSSPPPPEALFCSTGAIIQYFIVSFILRISLLSSRHSSSASEWWRGSQRVSILVSVVVLYFQSFNGASDLGANDNDEAEQNHPLHQSKKSLNSFVYVSLKLCLVLRILNGDMVMDTSLQMQHHYSGPLLEEPLESFSGKLSLDKYMPAYWDRDNKARRTSCEDDI